MTEYLFNSIAAAYDMWFEEHPIIYQSELRALETFIPPEGSGLDIGTGTGRFAEHLGIKTGIEPAPNMAERARNKGIAVKQVRAEKLPFADELFDFALMVTIDCFLDNLDAAYWEAYRVLKPNGRLISGMLDKNGALARQYRQEKSDESVYSKACFHTPEETKAKLHKVGFKDIEFCQTLVNPNPVTVEKPQPGYGKGSFVVIKGVRPNSSHSL